MKNHEQVGHLVDLVEFLIQEFNTRPEHAKLLRLAFYGDKTWKELSEATGLGNLKVKYTFNDAFRAMKKEVREQKGVAQRQERELKLLLEALQELPQEHKKKFLLLVPVSELDFSVRALNCMNAAGIRTLGQLVSYSLNDLLKFRNFGMKSIGEIQELLKKQGLELRSNT